MFSASDKYPHQNGAVSLTDAYQKEQIDTLVRIIRAIRRMDPGEIEKLRAACSPYLRFRKEADAFLSRHFAGVCTKKCYESRMSACCSKDGIVTFFADVVINVLFSTDREVKRLLARLKNPANPHKCIYLGDIGCVWQVKPIVCEMFLCDTAMESVFEENPEAREAWEKLKRERKRFTWPDRPILFDDIESYFLSLGIESPLMYLHNSPGLLTVKQNAKRGRP